MMFSKTTPAVLATLFIGASLGATALACSTDGWDSVSGAVVVGSPFDANPPDENDIHRFEEFCALRANGMGHVHTNAPSHGRVRIRLYAWPDLTANGTETVAGEADVLLAFGMENGTGELFGISYDDGLWWLDASANGGGLVSTPATGGWDQLEVDWDPATSMVHLWVNTDAGVDLPTVSTASGPAGTVEAVRVGLPAGLGAHSGQLYVDSVEMHNETAIGPLFNCDSDPNGDINISDVVGIIDEFTEAELSNGTPNCHPLGGEINISDVVATIDAFTSQ